MRKQESRGVHPDTIAEKYRRVPGRWQDKRLNIDAELSRGDGGAHVT